MTSQDETTKAGQRVPPVTRTRKGWRDARAAFREIPSLLHMHWDHEPTPNPSQEGNRKYADERLLPSWEGSGVGWFDDSGIVHWGHEPLAVPRRTESADKSDALQTLRARGRVSGPRVSVWSACVFSEIGRAHV